jgi:hypothetical protein
MTLGELTLESVAEMALHSGCANAFPPSQQTPVDAVQMPLKDRLAERLTGALAGQNAWQALAELTAAIQAKPFAGLHFQDTLA